VDVQLGNDFPKDTVPRERPEKGTALSLHPTPLQRAHVGRETEEMRCHVSDATRFLNKQKDLTVITEKYACYCKKNPRLIKTEKLSSWLWSVFIWMIV